MQQRARAASSQRVVSVEWPEPEDVREMLSAFSARLQGVETALAELQREDERGDAEVWGKIGDLEAEVKTLKAWSGTP